MPQLTLPHKKKINPSTATDSLPLSLEIERGILTGTWCNMINIVDCNGLFGGTVDVMWQVGILFSFDTFTVIHLSFLTLERSRFKFAWENFQSSSY